MIARHGAGSLVLALLSGCAQAPAVLPAPVRFAAPIPESRVLSTFAVSRDGQWLAYAAESGPDGKRRIFIRSLLAADAQDRELPGTVGGANPFFSPDGASLAFLAAGHLWRARTDGLAEPLRIADACVECAGATWTDAGRIVFARSGRQGLMEVAAAGGTDPVPLTVPGPREIEHGWPHALPGGVLAFTVSERGRDPHVELLLPNGERRRLRVPIAGQIQFVDSGYLVYGYLGNLMAVKLDLEGLEIRGVPTAIAKDLQTAGGSATLGRTGFAVSRTGTLVWLRASPDDAKNRLVIVSRDGRHKLLSAPADVYQTPRLSPDGRQLAVVARPGVMTREVRVLDVSRPQQVLFAVREGDNQSPAWIDNRRLTVASNRDGQQKIYVVAADGTATPLFTAAPDSARNPSDWSRSARLLALYQVDPGGRRDVLVYRVGESIAPVAASNANERSPVLSPDDRWIAYVSDASGSDEIYIKALDGPAGPLQLTKSGASEPVWTREGLFYREGDRMMLVSLQSGVPGIPQQIFEGYFDRDPGANAAGYDVGARGDFIMLKSALVPRELRVVRHWGTELVNQLGEP